MKKSKRNGCYGNVAAREKGKRRRFAALAAAWILSALLPAGCGRAVRTDERDSAKKTEAAGAESGAESAEEQKAGTESAGAQEAAGAESAGKQEAGAEPAGAQEAAGAESAREQEAGAESAGAQEAAGAESAGKQEAGAESARNEGTAAGGRESRPATMADLLQESGNMPDTVDAPKLPDTVLWFNATYACLTYTNGCDWRWVGGLEPTEENADKVKYLLYSGWNVTDRKSGIETVNDLLGGGHRAKCQECMDDLEEWGLMDLDEMQFVNEITKALNGEKPDIDLGNTPGRYVVAYYMNRAGIGAEYIAAWDFCRVNQLYADFYLCGFMDYEEAMDASYENSLRLQKMYDSWEEMMDAYLLGYQFWQGDPDVSDDSPVRERRSYYEMLKNSGDNPYKLDWNMELKKSW